MLKQNRTFSDFVNEITNAIMEITEINADNPDFKYRDMCIQHDNMNYYLITDGIVSIKVVFFKTTKNIIVNHFIVADILNINKLMEELDNDSK